jgi:release factor glutamine methyltransferase
VTPAVRPPSPPVIDRPQPSPGDVPTLLIRAVDRLTAAGVPSPRVDAELLLAHVLGVPRNRLLSAGGEPEAGHRAEFAALVERRAAREPVQHLIGTAWFRHVEVGAGVFVPRPETELLADAVLPVLRAAATPVAVDLCAGSGALALALADEAPAARVVAVEQRGPATDWLARNAAGSRVEVVVGDVRDAGLLADLRGGVDAVVANPPYVPAGTPVDPEVRADPPEAVFAGADGMALVPHVAARAADLLRPGGVLAVEHDATQGAAVPALLAADGRWRAIAGHRDLAGRPRYCTAVRG